MTHRVLISDAHMANRRMLHFAMELKGCEVLECVEAGEIPAILQQHRIDLILISLYHHESEGYAVLETLQEYFTPETLPVILIGDTVLRAEFDTRLWYGRAWLDRPFQVSVLMTLVDGILSQSQTSSDGTARQ